MRIWSENGCLSKEVNFLFKEKSLFIWNNNYLRRQTEIYHDGNSKVGPI